MENQNTIVIYSRKSRFTGKGESIGNQVELCRNYIRAVFGETSAAAAVVFEDEGFSGGNLNRPGFRNMMETARKRECRAVVVYRLDRISRNIGDFASLIEELGRLGIDFVSIRENFDTSSPMGRAMMYIASVFSQLERETIAERIRDNMHELAKTGRWLGGTTPTGYASESVRSVSVDGKSRKSCRLKLIPEEAELVRTIFRLYAETDSLTGTEAELLRRGLKTKNGRNFTRFSIKAILQNPVYLIADREARLYFEKRQAEMFCLPSAFDGVRGILAYNRTDQEKGRTTHLLPVSEWIVSVGQHPGIIPSELWIHTQESLERNKSGAYRKPRINEALLTGLLWCSCGSRMYPKLTRRLSPDGGFVFHYICKTKEHSKRCLCDCRNADGNRLDAAVLALIGRIPADKNKFLAAMEQNQKRYAARPRRHSALEAARRQRTELQGKLGALVDALAGSDSGMTAEHISQRIKELHDQDAELRARIEEMEAAEADSSSAIRKIESLCRSFDECNEFGADMTLEQKRAAVHMLVSKVLWNGRHADVMFYGSDEDKMENMPDRAPVRLREDCK